MGILLRPGDPFPGLPADALLGKEELGDLGLTEGEAAAAPEVLMALIHVLTGRRRDARVGVSCGGLADHEREADE